MKLLLFCLLFVTGTVCAQETPKPVPDMPVPEENRESPDRVFERVEIEPRFKGDLSKFLEKNIKYPKKAKRKKIEGTVIVEFVVDQEGHVSDAKIARGSPSTDKLLAAEAIRVINLTDNQWNAGFQNGRKIRCFHRQPVNFTLK